VLLAGGMRYAVPDTPGVAELWGDAAFACPYCHGWEHRDQRIGLLGATGIAHRVALLRSWSDDLVALADGGELAPEDRDALRTAEVPLVDQPVAAVAPGLVRFADGDELAVDALHVVAPMAPRDDLAARLGIETTEHANGTGIAVADKFGATSVPGVFAAGDAAGAGNVAAAIATGSLAGTGLHRTLISAQGR
jgi:thioredoxin reductase